VTPAVPATKAATGKRTKTSTTGSGKEEQEPRIEVPLGLDGHNSISSKDAEKAEMSTAVRRVNQVYDERQCLLLLQGSPEVTEKLEVNMMLLTYLRETVQTLEQNRVTIVGARTRSRAMTDRLPPTETQDPQTPQESTPSATPPQPVEGVPASIADTTRTAQVYRAAATTVETPGAETEKSELIVIPEDTEEDTEEDDDVDGDLD
jgi:hypothetical protein